MEKILTFFRGIMTTVTIVSLLVLILASFSDFISPVRLILSAYLGLFFPFILAWNVALLLGWLFFQKWKQVGMILVSFLICGGAIHTYFPLHSKTKDLPKDCIKVLTYNVMSFDWMEKPSRILEYVVKQDPDIVCFQEFALSQDDDHLTKKDVTKALKKLPYSYIEPDNHIAVFSKFPIKSTKKIPIKSEAGNGSFIAELDVHGKKVVLINNHLESNKIAEDERAAFRDMTKEPDAHKLKRFFSQTLLNRLTPAFKWRAKQANDISEVIKHQVHDATTGKPYIIVCGDFNDTPISYAHHKIKGDLVDSFVESGSGMGITFNKYRFLFRIDYIFHSKNIKSYNTTVGQLRDSDHYPLTTYLQLQ
ncbi:MAG: endonuclease/exonuclease/phosphatase family protein [Bacteroidales bacterium]|jgi:endonuclease/exonuclease/phosphatase family metal-dependent hydrolase|nr:endonuclease/exonuclease/phosphatase family protein [Bacteroidales bacterium]